MAASPSSLRTLAIALATAAAAVGYGSSRTTQGLAPSDPFGPGVRWAHVPAGPDWLPSEVALAADGELAWAATGGGGAGLVLLASGALGDAEVRRTVQDLPPTVGPLRVASSERMDAHYAGYQVAAPDPSMRQTWVRRYDPLAGADFDHSWEHALGAPTNGAHLLCADDARVVAAVHQSGAGAVRIDWLAPETGAPITSAELDAPSLTSLALASEGGRVAVVAGPTLFVLEPDGAGGTRLVFTLALAASTRALALSASGTALAVGDGTANADARLRVFDEQASGYVERTPLVGLAGEIALQAALSADGATLAAGWWNAVTGRTARYELWEGVPPVLRASWSHSNPASGPQEYPAALALTFDGRRAACGFWGGDDLAPQLVLLDRDAGTAVATERLAGSVLSIAVSADGTRVAVGAKDTHANQVGSTGRHLLVDTGERDLQVLGAPAPGSGLELVQRGAGLDAALFLAGQPSEPARLPGIAGALAIDLAEVWGAVASDWVRAGRAGVTAPLPAAPGLVGAQIAVQGLYSGAAGLSFTDAHALPAIF